MNQPANNTDNADNTESAETTAQAPAPAPSKGLRRTVIATGVPLAVITAALVVGGVPGTNIKPVSYTHLTLPTNREV